MSLKIKHISYSLLLLPVIVFIHQLFFSPSGSQASLNGPHVLLILNLYFILMSYRKPMCGLSKRINMKIVGSWVAALVSVYLLWFIFFSTNVVATGLTMAYFLYLLAVFIIAVYPYFRKIYTVKAKKV